MIRDEAVKWLRGAANTLMSTSKAVMMLQLADALESNSWDDDPPSPGATEKGATVPTPDEFAARMKATYRPPFPGLGCDSYRVKIMCCQLRALGYGKGVDIFEGKEQP